MELSQRKEMILSAIIERFLTTGEPVGSKFLAGMLNTPISPATVRNEMAYLSEMGYLDQPHTSAGRIPADKGYRYYIDKLLQNFSPSDEDMFAILSSIDNAEGDGVSILSQICQVLANSTGLVAIVSTPFSDDSVITGTKLIPLNKKTAMVVVSNSLGITKSRISRLSCEVDYSLMELYYNVTAANFIGSQGSTFTQAKLQTVAAALGDRFIDIMPLIVSFFEAALETSSSNIIVKGQSNLLNSAEFTSSAKDIIDFLRNTDAVLSLMDNVEDAPVSLKIGTENEFSSLRSAAVIKSTYTVKETGRGAIGVIGPTKTDYSRVIPLVKYISEIAGSLLNEIVDN